MLSRYSLKVIVAVLTVSVAAGACLWFREIPLACFAVVVGGSFMLLRHVSRCPFCGSWRTREERRVVHGTGVYGEVVKKRSCFHCGEAEALPRDAEEDLRMTPVTDR